MSQGLSIEKIAETATSGYEIGDELRVKVESCHGKDYFIYLGWISARPEDKADYTTVIKIGGEERIIGQAPTFTLETTAKTQYQLLDMPEGQAQQYVVTDLRPATLVFDPSSTNVHILPSLELVVPLPR